MKKLKQIHWKTYLAGAWGLFVPVLTFAADQQWGKASLIASALVGLLGALGLLKTQPPPKPEE